MNCESCDNLERGYPIKVVDIPSKHFLDIEKYHFEDGFKCTWNGNESLNINDLSNGSCRCRGDNL